MFLLLSTLRQSLLTEAGARLTGSDTQVNLLSPPMNSNSQCRVTGMCDYAQILHGAGDPNSCRHAFRASTIAL